MALTLLNHFYWQIPEAKVPFVIADVVIVVAMRYVEKGIAAEKKLQHIEEQHADQDHEMDKGEKLAQRQKAVRQQHHKKMGHKASGTTGGGRNKNINNIQQPSKHD